MAATPPTDDYVLWEDTDPETLRLYSLLPEFFRRADAADTSTETKYPLLRWLDTTVRWYGDVARLVDRFNYPQVNPSTSDLVDPYTSDESWTRWLGQLVNIVAIQTPDIVTTSSWQFLYSLLDAAGNSDGVPQWWEWQGDSSQGANDGDNTWEYFQNANLSERTQLTPVRDAINRRRLLANSYTTARNAHGYYDGSGPSITAAIKAVLTGQQYVWVGNYAELVQLGPVRPNSVTVTGSATDYFALTSTVDLGRALVLPGTAGNLASTPHSAAFQNAIVEFVFRVAPESVAAGTEVIQCKRGATTGFEFSVERSGSSVVFRRSYDGTTWGATGTSTGFLTAGTYNWVKITHNATTGALAFFSASDSAVEPTSWTARGTATTTTGTPHAGTNDLVFSTNRTTEYFAGRISRSILRTGASPTTVLDVDFSQQNEGATSFSCTTNQTITITQGATEPKAQIYTGREIVLAMDRTVTSTVTNQSLSLGSGINISQTTTALVVGVGDNTATGVLPNGSRGAVRMRLNFNYPGNCKVTATHTPNGGSASTVINGVNVATGSSFNRPSGPTIFTFGRGLSGTIYSATIDGTVANINEFAVTNRYLNTGTARASDTTIWGNSTGDSFTFNYTGTPYSGTATVAPEWTRIHVVTRSEESPNNLILFQAIETARPAGFEIVLHSAIEGP